MRIMEKTPGNTADEKLLSREEMLRALELMIHRMDAIDANCANGFPLYSPGSTDQWLVSPGGSWVGGFWAGGWWLRAKVAESRSDQHKASAICQRLDNKIGADSINRSMIFWYGAALGDNWFSDEHARKLVKEAVAALAASYDPEIQCIPVGTDMGGGKEGNRLITLDTVAPLIQLFSRSECSRHEYISRWHADTLLAACRTDGDGFHTAACYEQGNFRPTDQAGEWSRGQAWALLGLSRAAAQWGEPYLSYARSACEYWRDSRPEPLPPNRLSYPSGLCDPSSSVIASLAMLAIADLIANGEQWRTYAHQQISAIIRSRYFTGFQENGDKAAHGIFWGCCYKTNQGKDELVESAWGSFFLMSALAILVDAIKPGDC